MVSAPAWSGARRACKRRISSPDWSDRIHRRGLDGIFEYLSRIAPDELEELDLVGDGMNLTKENIYKTNLDLNPRGYI